MTDFVKFMNDSHYYEGERVSFMKMGLKIAELLFKPENFDENKKYPAIVVTHPGVGEHHEPYASGCPKGRTSEDFPSENPNREADFGKADRMK